MTTPGGRRASALDISHHVVHDRGMVEKGLGRRRVFVEDARRNGAYLRATWHAEAGQFVLSTWHDDVCTGAVRVAAFDVAGLVGFFADGLADAARPAVHPDGPAKSLPVRRSA